MTSSPEKPVSDPVRFRRVYWIFFTNGKGSFNEKDKETLGISSAQIIGIRLGSYIVAISLAIIFALNLPEIPSVSSTMSTLIKAIPVWAFGQPLFAALWYYMSVKDF